jgi:hypothetical protein
MFIKDHMDTTVETNIASLVNTLFNEYLGDQVDLINYYKPIREHLTIKKDGLIIEDDTGNNLFIDKRNNLIISSFTRVNNSALKPTQPEEI